LRSRSFWPSKSANILKLSTTHRPMPFVLALLLVFAAPLSASANYVYDQRIVKADGAANDFFATDIAVTPDGIRMVIGSSDENTRRGAAYVYMKSNGAWVLEQRFTANDVAAEDKFGSRVAISDDGTRVVIVAPVKTTAVFQEGAAYVFFRSGSTWTQEQRIVAADASIMDRLGQGGVAISSDGLRIAVSANWDTIGANAMQGSGYIFLRSGTVWSQEAKLYALDGSANDNFGCPALSPDGAHVIFSTSATDSARGAAYAYSRSGTTWTLDQKIVEGGGAAGDKFGMSCGLSDDGLSAVCSRVGRAQGALVFLSRSGTTWTQGQILDVSESWAGYSATDFRFQQDGSRIVMGEVTNSATIGYTNVFVASNGVWSRSQRIESSSVPSASGIFGWRVDVSASGGELLASDILASVGSNQYQGAVYSFILDSTPPTISSVSSAPSSHTSTITWTTSEPTTSTITYNGGSASDSLASSHALILSDLSQCTEYTYTITSTDAGANTASHTASFRTDCGSVPIGPWLNTASTPAPTPTPISAPSPSPTPPSAPSFRFTSLLSRGSRGPAVSALQSILKSEGFFPADTDITGFFGPLTLSSLKSFQSAHHLDPVGYTGPLTRGLLNTR
jgi:hypothetical protein